MHIMYDVKLDSKHISTQVPLLSYQNFVANMQCHLASYKAVTQEAVKVIHLNVRVVSTHARGGLHHEGWIFLL